MRNLKATHRTEDAAMPSPRWQELQDRLRAAKRPIFQELRDYPPQVAGCDLHFKALAEKRDAVCRELDRLDTLRGATAQELDAFAASSVFLNKDG
ncbi:hypothetical protein RJ527_11995 [Thalassospiraceae bacterium LMO-SO8]|nr:hypothetical protein [Alphaproteobacteria bacterium LMO-S08]WND74763.1 hypothetical protein RJ527_11995 [Thalassospiraceae bacterium LMO-SO8]